LFRLPHVPVRRDLRRPDRDSLPLLQRPRAGLGDHRRAAVHPRWRHPALSRDDRRVRRARLRGDQAAAHLHRAPPRQREPAPGTAAQRRAPAERGAGRHDSMTAPASDGQGLSQPATDAVARIAGLLLLVAFFSLDATANGLRITFRGDLTTSSPGELNFWLGQVLLLCPSMLLLGYGLGAHVRPLFTRIAARVNALTPRERRLGVLALTLVALAVYRIGRAVFLLDLPMTDDEYAVDFGGRIMASGHLMTRYPLPREALPSLFLFFRDGAVGSFDWPGGQAVA